MTSLPDDGERGVSPAVALYSILGFWLFYAILVTLRAAVMGFESQGELGIRRAVVTVIGIVVTWVLYLVLRRFDAKPLSVRIVAAFSLAAPFALAMASANFYMFNVYDPVNIFTDGDRGKYASEEAFALIQISSSPPGLASISPCPTPAKPIVRNAALPGWSARPSRPNCDRCAIR